MNCGRNDSVAYRGLVFTNPLLRLREQRASSATVWVYWLCSCTVSLSLLSGILPQLTVKIYLLTLKREVRIANVDCGQQL